MTSLDRTRHYIEASRLRQAQPLVREDCGTGKYSAFETWVHDMAALLDDGGVLQAMVCAGIVIAILLLIGGKA